MNDRVRLTLLLLLALLAGCSRTRYRLAADRDAYSLLQQKSAHAPWAPPSDFSLHPLPTSRLHDPTPLDDPWLPMPAPQLYAYELPALAPRAPRTLTSPTDSPPTVHVDGMASRRDVGPGLSRLPPIGPNNMVHLATHLSPVSNANRPRASEVSAPVVQATARTRFLQPAQGNAPTVTSDEPDSYSTDVLRKPVPANAWEAVPESCVRRMFEFESLREEFRLSHGHEPGPERFAPGKRLTLEDIVELTLLNSREYQTQKEVLYRVALNLSLQRFAFQLKFSPGNNRTAATWNHTRNNGITVNGLNVPTSLQMEKMLVTGGDMIARFANSVVLTFNGPAGFATDVGSDLFLEFDQTIFQNDIRFEPLTQAERDVVYAARDFMRFRKTLFNQLASQYYSLIRTYRQVQIDSQNYFTLVRAFNQSQAEYRTNLLPRFQLDQVEQNVLSGRSRVIATCNTLEAALDNLKIRMGVPTETQLNANLTELEQLTSRDELQVTGELIDRISARLREERQSATPNRSVLLERGVVLMERLMECQRLRVKIGHQATTEDDLRPWLASLQVASAEETVAEERRRLQEELKSQPPQLSKVFQRTMDLLDAQIELLMRQIEQAEQSQLNADLIAQSRTQQVTLRQRAEALHEELVRIIDALDVDSLQKLVNQATELQQLAENTSQQIAGALDAPAVRPAPAEELRLTLEETDRLLAVAAAMRLELGGGLVPIEIELDAAMLTALNLRFDLMNQRGVVADAWRRIKFAGDDLKSILNITGSHTLSTDPDFNRAFNFTFDDSDTRVRATFDAPLNRRSQRNSYRTALIAYQASLRALMQLEDNIKLAVRNDLRSLALDKEQYAIEVASAALAYERVVSVLLEFRLGLGRVAARDFLEAQNAYASSLSNVASRHIGYVVDRTQLFLDMELLSVDDSGFWHELYDERYQPEPYYQLPDDASPVYGELVPGLWYSKYLRRMEQVAPGTAAIHEPPGSDTRPPTLEEIPTPPANP